MIRFKPCLCMQYTSFCKIVHLPFDRTLYVLIELFQWCNRNTDDWFRGIDTLTGHKCISKWRLISNVSQLYRCKYHRRGNFRTANQTVTPFPDTETRDVITYQIEKNLQLLKDCVIETCLPDTFMGYFVDLTWSRPNSDISTRFFLVALNIYDNKLFQISVICDSFVITRSSVNWMYCLMFYICTTKTFC